MKNRVYLKWMLALFAVVLLLSNCSGNGGGKKTYSVGLLSGVDTFNAVFDGFKAKMAELGYVEGENITYDMQAAGGDTAKMAEIAQQFVQNKVDLILTTTTGAAQAALEVTEGTDIAVLFTVVTDPVETGLVASIKAPGGNATGINRPDSAYFGKRVEFLTQMTEVGRLGIFYDPDYSTAASSLPPIRNVAALLGVELVEMQVKSADDVSAELGRLDQATDPGIDAIQMMPDLVNNSSFPAILAFANAHKLPVVGHTLGQVKQGALFSYADDNFQTGQMAATLAQKIFEGAKPGELPVETSGLFLTVNIKAAQTIGLEMPDTVLQAADEILRP
ncbi:MAG: ABC transporter substrate-binding protein [Anaerolineae bacterium]|nr:ABC transporter substrate-binding protein [Anaerolineae bacterium]